MDQKMHPFQVTGGGSGWQVAGRCLTQRETGDRMIGRVLVRVINSGFRSPLECLPRVDGMQGSDSLGV